MAGPQGCYVAPLTHAPASGCCSHPLSTPPGSGTSPSLHRIRLQAEEWGGVEVRSRGNESAQQTRHAQRAAQPNSSSAGIWQSESSPARPAVPQAALHHVHSGTAQLRIRRQPEQPCPPTRRSPTKLQPQRQVLLAAGGGTAGMGSCASYCPHQSPLVAPQCASTTAGSGWAMGG